MSCLSSHNVFFYLVEYSMPVSAQYGIQLWEAFWGTLIINRRISIARIACDHHHGYRIFAFSFKGLIATDLYV